MTKHFKLLTLMASAVMVFAACTTDKLEAYQGQPDLNSESPSNAISFGTYMGKVGTTRAGYEGSINSTTLQTNATNSGTQGVGDGANGFGVFAYYTGLQTYGQAQYDVWESSALKSTYAPNFMYNQRVYWDVNSKYDKYVNGTGSGASAAAWTYSPTKYWPNDFASTGVDDQDNNQAGNQATGSTTYGGNVSFFAYAPYVYVNGADGTPTSGKENYNGGATDGIVGITSNSTVGDPKITYVIADDGNVVDLLWGTYSGTKENAVSEADQPGVSGDGIDANDTPTEGTHTYSGSILKSYKTNADLTKQKTTGYVGFAFKHALAKVGGSTTTYSGDEAKNGFMVILDIDDFKGAEKGGSKEGATKVTINSITISNDLNGDSDTDDDNVSGIAEMGTNKGEFNLATGQWGSTTKSGAGVMNHTIYPANSDASSINAKLNPIIAEPLDETNHQSKLFDANNKNVDGTNGTNNLTAFFSPSGDFATQTGVRSDIRLAVYDGTEANPLVFIPGTTPSLKITVDYYVRTKDENLNRGYSEVRQVITKLVQFPTVELNKQYSLLMHLGLTSVKFTATVSNWDIAGDDNGDGVIDNETVNLKQTYLPINVSELQSVTPTISPATIPSQASTVNITSLALNYSDDGDDLTGVTDFASKGITFTSLNTGVATINATTGQMSFTANESTSARTVTIRVIRGNQTADYTFTQEGATFTSLALELSKTSSIALAGENVTATVTATYTHTDGTTTFQKNDKAASAQYSFNDGSTYTTDHSSATVTLPEGTSGSTIKVKAKYTDVTTSVTKESSAVDVNYVTE